MKNILMVLLMAFSISATAQFGNQRTDNFFSYPTNETLETKRLVKVQHSLFIDAFGKAPNGRGGRHFGYEMTAIMGLNKTAWFYIAPSLSSFPQLEDGYFDVVTSIGTNWHMFHTTAVRYYTGARLGLVWRGGGDPYPLVGISAGLDVRIITFRSGVTIHLGGELFSDYRTDQDVKWYGGKSGGGVIFTNEQVVDNGRFKLIFTF